MNKRIIAVVAAVLLIAVVAAVLLIAGCGSRPGADIVYERIENMTSCSALQSEFNTAMDNAEARPPGDRLRDVSLSYAKAADERMRNLGC